jgi:hypothetical protein
LWGERTGVDGTATPHVLPKGRNKRPISPCDIRSKTVWPPGRRQHTKSDAGYYRWQFEAAWASYCEPSATPVEGWAGAPKVGLQPKPDDDKLARGADRATRSSDSDIRTVFDRFKRERLRTKAELIPATGVSLTHVPYRGDPPALTDLLGGQVQVCFGSLPATIEYVRTGKVRALALTAAARLEALPDIPTVGEFVPGYEASFWYGIGAPVGTPAEVVDKLNVEINAALADPRMKARLAELGATVLPGSPADFGKLIAAETDKWRKVIRAANIRAD